MENVKYIPGDLVRSNNNPKIIWKVKDVSQDKKGNVLYRVRAVEEEEAFIYLYESQIAPIPLTPAILEANGWKEVPLAKGHYIRQQGISIFKGINGKGFLAQYEIGITVNMDFVHELQHFLFGLGLNSELKV